MKDKSDRWSFMRCRTCGKTSKKLNNDHRHHWDKGQCSNCHYLGFRGKRVAVVGRYGSTKRKIGMGSTLGDRVNKHRVRITEENIELYCKVTQIMRGRPCVKKRVLATQDNGRKTARIIIPWET